MGRLELHDSVKQAAVKLSDGIPAAQFVAKCLGEQAPRIDPYAGQPLQEPGIIYLMWLDDWRIYGSRLVMLVEICVGDLIKMAAVLRAVQLGIITNLDLNKAIDGAITLDLHMILARVQEEVPQFAGGPIGKSKSIELKEK